MDNTGNNNDYENAKNEQIEFEVERRIQAELKKRSLLAAENEKGNNIKKLSSEDAGIYKSKIIGGEVDSEDWLTTYADVITLMLTLFVLLFSYSKIDQKQFEVVKQSINKELLKKDDQTSFKNLEKKVNSIFKAANMGNKVLVSLDPKGLKIELSSSSLYDLGSADIKQDIIPTLRELSVTLKGMRFSFPNFMIEVEGHTDDIPINTSQYPSNWELSTNRATNIVRFFISEGFSASQLRAAGYADSRPKLPNRDMNGNPIVENQAANRRVVIFVQRQS